MELNPTSGRPKKDPEERRSELVHIRVRPSHKAIVEQEAERRDASMTLVVVRFSFEEMNPSGRLIPEPSIWRWLLDRAAQYRRVANDSEARYPHHELDNYEASEKAREVKKRAERRRELWRGTRDESREETIGIRLKPARLQWLEERAEQKNTTPSGLLRVRALEGIDRRDHMDTVRGLLDSLSEQADDIREKAKDAHSSAEKIREEMKELASEIEVSLDQIREKM